MGRSKNLHYVEHTVAITQPASADGDWINGVIQVDEILSEELGRTIRSGNQFRLVGYGANLKGFTGSSDQDVGFAGTAVCQFIPVTKNSVASWQKMFKQWTRQKQLASAVGEYVRYDDFEVGWDGAHQLPAARQSTIRMSGLSDVSSESVVLVGSSVDGSYVSLEQFYDNINPIAPPSETPFGTVIKTAKFVNRFPSRKELIMPTSFTAQVDTQSIPDSLAGGMANGEISWLPSDNHISHLTGTLFYYFKGVSPDTAAQIPDELKLTITLVYEGWSSIAPSTRTKSSPKKITSGKKTNGKN